mgnify:CR=1 FL=1|jgi:large subunit ribosomal protein L15
MRLDQLRAPLGARKNRKRIGRGNASRGTYSGRGMKGQLARAGGGVRPSFEGGQNPMVKRLPRQRGFVNIFKKQFSKVNLDRLYALFPNKTEVTSLEMKNANLIRDFKLPVKILGRGDATHSLDISAHSFSAEAKRKIEEAGGKALEI